LKNFGLGYCSPVILVPGTLSTKLTVEIDCELLKEKYPETFELCGWNSCESGYFKKSP